MKAHSLRLFFSMLLLGMGSCPKPISSPPGSSPQPASELPLVLIHTNDTHGQYLPNPAQWLPGKPKIGGMELLDSYIRSVRAQVGDERLLVMDAGDMLTGGPAADLEVNGAIGGAMTEFFADMGYDALTLGNHDFDKGFANSAALVAGSRVPFVSANLRDPSGSAPAFPKLQPSLIVRAAGQRVGIIGGITMEFPELTSADTLTRLKLMPLAESVRAEAARLDPSTDLLVLLCHCGIEEDRALAELLPEIDLIVGGHTHTAMKSPERVGSTWIVQAGSNARSVGRVEILVQNDSIASIHGELLDLLPPPTPPGASESLLRRVETYRVQLESMFGAQVGEARAALGRSDKRESPMGAWVSDALIQASGADIAVFNGGGLRADFAQGPLTLGSVHEVFPFTNELVVFTMSGEDLRALLLQNARAEHAADGSFLQFGGATYTWKLSALGPEIVKAEVAGRPIEPGRSYRVATNSYVTDQWKRHLPVEPREITILPRSVHDVALEAVKRAPVEPPPGWDTRSQRLP